MKTISNIIITHAILLALFAGAAYATAQEEPAICTADVMECPDGSYVSRNGPTCSFATCPAEKKSSKENKLEQEELKAEAYQNKTNQQEKTVGGAASGAKAQLTARSQERITNLAANMTNRTESVIDRLQNITDRLTTRLEKISIAGTDTSAAEEYLVAAQSSIDLAKQEITNIDTDVDHAVESDNAKAGWSGAREKFTNTRNLLKSAHNDLKSSLATIKAALGESTTKRVSDAVKVNSVAGNNPDEN